MRLLQEGRVNINVLQGFIASCFERPAHAAVFLTDLYTNMKMPEKFRQFFRCANAPDRVLGVAAED
jgi:hypothetical protein